jgi:hypothetical protein
MSRYFFHVMDGKVSADTNGKEFASLAAARVEAAATAGRMLADMEGIGWHTGREWIMTVADDLGRVVFTLTFSANDHGIKE